MAVGVALLILMAQIPIKQLEPFQLLEAISVARPIPASYIIQQNIPWLI